MRTGSGVVRLAAQVLVAALVIGGCGSGTGSESAAGTSVTPPPSAARSSGTGETAGPLPSGSSATDSAAPMVPGVAVDTDLLRVLPAQIDGVALVPDPTTSAQIAADPEVAQSAQAIAVALAIRPGSSTGDDLAVVSVIRLRPGVFSDAWFADWRTTYDQGACDVAGGIRGTPTQASIAGRTVYTQACAGDAQTYHVHLADPALIVSITAAGPARFGELVMAGLAE